MRLYYRASRDGEAVPRTGPVLLVGNHPNSLLDPAFLAWAAERPVRFLAKAPLFTDARVGWLVRASGSIPVYRHRDDPALMERNAESFRAVHEALAGGSAVALFPEGTSHSEPGLVPIKTGAARIALGALATVGRPFPIVPVGLVFRAKDRFRSQAHVVVGAAIAWDDLAGRTDAEQDAVRELTERIERGMRAVTLNLARWEDELVVRTAEAVWATTQGAAGSPAARVARLATAADVLARARASGDPQWDTLAGDVREHAQMLTALGVRPADIELDTRLGPAAWWALRRLTVVGVGQFALAAIAIVLFWIPYRLTGFVAGRMAPDKDTISTFRVLGGTLIFTLWIASIATAVLMTTAWWSGAAMLVALPAVAIGGLYAAERWQLTFVTVRRWMLLRRRDPRILGLRDRQHELARRLDGALAAHQAS